MKINGTVKKVGDIQEISASFQKRELIIQTNEQYPQVLCIEFVQDKTALLDSVQEGSVLEVHINIRGREWTNPKGETKYFVSLQGWKIEIEAATTSPAPKKTTPSAPTSEGIGANVPDDDLPF